MENKTLKLGIALFACLLECGCADSFYIQNVNEDDLIGTYAVLPYEVIDKGETIKYFDTFVIKKNGELERVEYENHKRIRHYLGNWHYITDGRYSIPVDDQANDVEPQKNWMTKEIRIEISTLTYYKL